MGTHERLTASSEVKISSDRNFGFVFAGVFLLAGVFPLLHENAPRLWALLIAAAFLVIALARPALLRPLNLLWFRFGMVLHKIMSTIVMGVLFFIVLTPVAFLSRTLGKDPLRLRPDPTAKSYWIIRTPRGPSADSMKNQF